MTAPFFMLALLLLASTIKAVLNDCQYEGLSLPVAYIVCSVQSGSWFIDLQSSAIKNVGCLLGSKKTARCDRSMQIPTPDQVPPSPAPPDAKIKEYQALATIAEKLIPQTWWRQGFASDLLLLTHNDTELPRRMLDVTRIRNKKLKNIVQCVTRQQFIRKSFSFQVSQHSVKCKAASETVVKSFFKTWKSDVPFSTPASASSSTTTTMEWSPNLSENGKMLVSALEVLDYFYQNYGGVWTGCFQFDDSSSCRGALAGKLLIYLCLYCLVTTMYFYLYKYTIIFYHSCCAGGIDKHHS